MNVPKIVEVLRTDRVSGQCVYVIVDPAAKEVTHIVVKRKERLYLQRLIDLGFYDRLVEENTLALSRLN